MLLLFIYFKAITIFEKFIYKEIHLNKINILNIMMGVLKTFEKKRVIEFKTNKVFMEIKLNRKKQVK